MNTKKAIKFLQHLGILNMYVSDSNNDYRLDLILEQYHQSRLPKNINNLETSISDLDLSPRTYRCLRGCEIRTLGEITKYSEKDLLLIRKFGVKSLNEINEMLAIKGLKLKEK